jgi:hypothetical protein
MATIVRFDEAASRARRRARARALLLLALALASFVAAAVIARGRPE